MSSLSQTSTQAQTPMDLILWDVVEEHLDEAAFLWTQWERALRSPLYKLHELRDRVEERLLAHLDGLVVGGSQVAQRLLVPALCEGLPGTAFAAAMALLLAERADADDAVFAALSAAQAPQLDEIVRALCLGPSPQRQARLLSLFAEGGARQTVAAYILGFQQVDLGPSLFALFRGDDSQQWLTGLHCLRYRPRPDCESLMVRALRSADVAVVDAGLVAAAVAALPSVLPRCRELVESAHPATPTAALLLAILGTDIDQHLLRRAASNKKHAKDIIFALGLCGGIDSMSACVDWLGDDDLALAASESFVSLTGVDAEKEKLLTQIPSSAENDDFPDGDADLDLPVEADIPRIDPLATAAFWHSHRTQYKAGAFYLGGQVFVRSDPRAWQAAVSQANLRQRHALALGLAVVSAGQQIIQTGALARQQADVFAA